MLIGDLVTRGGLTKDTIRFYEKRGLISLDKKDRRDNRYKEYSQQVLDKLLLIKQLKSTGFTLGEIDVFLALWREEDASCKKIRYVIENKLAQVDNQIENLLLLKSKLLSSLDNCKQDACEFEKTIRPLVI